MSNILKHSDSYKYSHSFQFPENMISGYSYMSSRGGRYPAVVFIGLQFYLKKYFMGVPTKKLIKRVAKMAEQHGVPFDTDAWKQIHELGYIPLRISAVNEGALIPAHMVLMTIESTDSRFAWLVGFVETLLMKLWYPINIATKSYYVKQMLLKYGPIEWASFAYHNFGDRGSSSVESADIGGFAHSSQFYGTDNFGSLFFAKKYYGAKSGASYSVFATEHFTTTSNCVNKVGEEDFVVRMLNKFPDRPIMAFVGDTYDIYEFTDMCTNPSRPVRQIIDERGTQKLVIRPDSGDPIEVLGRMITIMRQNGCGSIIDGQYYLKNYAILWGDGIDPETIESILKFAQSINFAVENFLYGSGGDLMQNHTRDTNRFAIKGAEISLLEDGLTIRRGISKDPITDKSKSSKEGRVTTWYDTEAKVFIDGTLDVVPNMHCVNALRPIFENGRLLVEYTEDEIRSCTVGHQLV